jgi:hypothetical protein
MEEITEVESHDLHSCHCPLERRRYVLDLGVNSFLLLVPPNTVKIANSRSIRMESPMAQ